MDPDSLIGFQLWQGLESQDLSFLVESDLFLLRVVSQAGAPGEPVVPGETPGLGEDGEVGDLVTLVLGISKKSKNR